MRDHCCLSSGIELLLRDQVYEDCYPLHAVRASVLLNNSSLIIRNLSHCWSVLSLTWFPRGLWPKVNIGTPLTEWFVSEIDSIRWTSGASTLNNRNSTGTGVGLVTSSKINPLDISKIILVNTSHSTSVGYDGEWLNDAFESMDSLAICLGTSRCYCFLVYSVFQCFSTVFGQWNMMCRRQ